MNIATECERTFSTIKSFAPTAFTRGADSTKVHFPSLQAFISAYTGSHSTYLPSHSTYKQHAWRRSYSPSNQPTFSNFIWFSHSAFCIHLSFSNFSSPLKFPIQSNLSRFCTSIWQPHRMKEGRLVFEMCSGKCSLVHAHSGFHRMHSCSSKRP